MGYFQVRPVFWRKYMLGFKQLTQVLEVSQRYKTQGFRALNQALGRGIRHTRDWCALVLLDKRYKEPGFKESIPKWLRQDVRDFGSLPNAVCSIEEFMKRHYVSWLPAHEE